MFKHIKDIIKEIYSGLTISWKHKHTLFTLSLLVALIFPVVHSIVGDFTPKSYASYEKEYAQVSPDLITRTKEIHDSMLMTAFYYALQEDSQKINKLMEYNEEEVRALMK